MAEDKKEIVVLKPEEKPEIKTTLPAVNINIGTLNIFLTPARAALQGAKVMAEPLRRHYHRKYKPHYKHSKKLFLLDMILLAIIAGFLIFNGYYFFFRKVPSEKIIVEIKISPETVKSGEEVTFLINYANNEEVALQDAKLSFQLPPHFYARLFFPPLDRQNKIFNIGTIEPGARGQLKITGRILGGLGDKQKIYTTLNYGVSDIKKPGQKNFSLSYNLEGSLLESNFSLPEQIKINENFIFTFDYINNSFDEFKNIVLMPSWPGNFKLIKSEPEIEDGRWLVPGLGQGSQGAVKIEGLLSSLNNGPAILCFNSFIQLENSNLKQNEICRQLKTVPVIVSFNQQVNGQDDYTAELGEELNYIIGYKNESGDNLVNVKITMALAEKVFNFSTLNIEGGRLENNQLVWNKIDRLKPGQSGELKFSIKLKEALAEPNNDLTATIKPRVIYSVLSQENQVEGPELKTKINTKLFLKAAARYYSPEGEQLGVGPLPPQVGEITKYWILLQPGSTTSIVKDVKITALLPDNVKWAGEVMASLGQGIKYNQQNREVSWQIDELKPQTDGDYKVLGGGFEVELIPTSRQVGQPAVLLKNIKISGRDKFTGQSTVSQIQDIDTNLEQDSQAAGKGVVVNK